MLTDVIYSQQTRPLAWSNFLCLLDGPSSDLRVGQIVGDFPPHIWDVMAGDFFEVLPE